MATLHGILAELGIASPTLHPEREVHYDEPHWIVDKPFEPVAGLAYELAYVKTLTEDDEFEDDEHYIIRRVRIDSADASAWFDLDTGVSLEAELRTLPVRGFRTLH